MKKKKEIEQMANIKIENCQIINLSDATKIVEFEKTQKIKTKKK